MRYHVTIGSRVLVVELESDRVLVDGQDVGSADLIALPGTPVKHLLLDDRSVAIVAQHIDDTWSLHVDGWPVRAEVVDERTRAIRAMTSRTSGPQGRAHARFALRRWRTFGDGHCRQSAHGRQRRFPASG
jgi:hypothetical protein